MDKIIKEMLDKGCIEIGKESVYMPIDFTEN